MIKGIPYCEARLRVSHLLNLTLRSMVSMVRVQNLPECPCSLQATRTRVDGQTPRAAPQVAQLQLSSRDSFGILALKSMEDTQHREGLEFTQPIQSWQAVHRFHWKRHDRESHVCPSFWCLMVKHSSWKSVWCPSCSINNSTVLRLSFLVGDCPYPLQVQRSESAVDRHSWNLSV